MSRLLFLILCLLPFLTQAQGPTGKENVKSSNSSFEKEVLNLINKERKKRNIPALKWDEDLARAARYHAKDMADDNYFEHVTMDRKNNKLVTVLESHKRLLRFNPSLRATGENIALGQQNPEEVVKSWMKSSGHRSNILDKDFKITGLGVYQNPKSQTLYWVNTFGGN